MAYRQRVAFERLSSSITTVSRMSVFCYRRRKEVGCPNLAGFLGNPCPLDEVMFPRDAEEGNSTSIDGIGISFPKGGH